MAATINHVVIRICNTSNSIRTTKRWRNVLNCTHIRGRYTDSVKSRLFSNSNHCLTQQTWRRGFIYNFCVRTFKSQNQQGNGRKVAGSLRTRKVKWLPEAKEVAATTEKVIGRSALIKPFIFTVSVITFSFIGAAVWQYENMLVFAQTLLKENWRDNIHIIDRMDRKRGEWRQNANELWGSIPESKRIAATIIFLNGLVFLAWRLPSAKAQAFMMTYFTSSLTSKAVCLPMILSTFSHYSLFHIFCNMYVLWNFSDPVINMMGKEQFLAFYLSAGVVSSMAGLVFKNIAFKSAAVSLGASGAILGMLGATCTQYPDALLNIIFLPMITFTAGTALKGIILFDAAGLLMRWKVFDHAAHLGGVLFGVLYVKYGNQYLWKNREPVMSIWHRIRRKFRKTPPTS